MTNDDYKATLDMVANAVRILRMVPLREALDAAKKIDNTAWFLEPTKWHMGGGKQNVEDQIRLLSAALSLVREVEAIVREHGGDVLTP